MMDLYSLEDLCTGEILTVDLQTAVQVMAVLSEEILWCIEEFGVCETESYSLKMLFGEGNKSR